MAKHLRPSRVLLAAFAATTIGCVGIGGETIRLEHAELQAPDRSLSGRVPGLERAEDLRDTQERIGRATVTLFAIPSGSVTTQGHVTEEVVTNVKEGLEAVGYDVDVTDQVPGNEPCMLVKIDELHFRNYNWLWPYVPTWGHIGLTVEVRRPDGRIAYERSFRASGRSHCLTGACAFTNASRAAMTEVLDQMIADFASQEFRTAMGLPALLEAPAVAAEPPPQR